MPIKRVSLFNYRSFPLKGTRLPVEGFFSPRVNLIVGPNGSGKTTFMNAMKLSFERDAENSQSHLTAARMRKSGPKTERNTQDAPWYCEIEAEYSDPAATFSATWQVHESEAGAPLRRKMIMVSPRGADERAISDCLRDRGFPLGWPRRLGHLNQKAFVTASGQNQDHYESAWKNIQDDVRKYLGYEVPHPGEWITEKGWACPTCTKTREEGILGQNLLDEHGVPVFEGSDGVAHFFYMILEIRKHKWPTSFFIEEPDVYLHPSLQRKFLEYVLHLSEKDSHQFFITTHSPYLLNFAKREELDAIALLHFDYRERATKVTSVSLDSERWQLLAALGHRPGDVMQPSGIIWVEGPSDKIYLKIWLDAYARENGLTTIRWGLDCDVVWYGGHNITYVNMEHYFKPDASGKPALLSLLTLNPNASFLLDADHGADGTKQFFDQKKRVLEECKTSGRFCWLVEPQCIEDGVSQSIVDKLRPRGGKWPPEHDKPRLAEEYSERAKSKKLSDILKHGLGYEEAIARLYREVDRWRKG